MNCINRKQLVGVLLLLFVVALAITTQCEADTQDEVDEYDAHSVVITEFEEAIEAYAPTAPTGRYESIGLTDYERGLIAMVVYREARGESDAGQRAVVEIILNRYLETFGGAATIHDVIYAKNQFSCADALTTRSITELGCLSNAFNIVDEVLKESTYEVKSYYMYFKTGEPETSDYIKIGNHYFY